MAEGLQTADGKGIDVPPIGAEQGFAELMRDQAGIADGQPAEMPAPPKRDADAPYGRTLDGKPKRGPGGRPPKKADKPKVDKPRTAAPPVPEGTYTRPVAEFLEALTIVGATAPVPEGALRTKVRLQAHLVNAHAAGLATAIDKAACNNKVIRRGVEALTMGSAGWVLPAVLAVAPFAAQSAGLWRAPVDEEMTQGAEQFEAGVREQLQAAVAQAQAA